MWECENDHRHPESYKIVMEMFYFQFVGSPTCSLVNIHHYSPPLQCITVKYCVTLHYKFFFFFKHRVTCLLRLQLRKLTNKKDQQKVGKFALKMYRDVES